jgi:hypothetical protein
MAVTHASVPDEQEHLPLTGRVVIQGLVFTWTCESRAMLKVHHPQYGMRIVSVSRHYEPGIMAKLTALGMLAQSNDVDLNRPETADGAEAS